MLQQAAQPTLSTLYVQHLLLAGLERPFKHCSRLCELRPAAIAKLLPFSGCVQPSLFNSGLAAELSCAVAHCMTDIQKHHRCTVMPIADSHACAGSHAGANSAARALQSEARFWQRRRNAAVSRCNPSCAQSRGVFKCCYTCETSRCLHNGRSAPGSHCVLIWPQVQDWRTQIWLGY